MSLLLEKPNAYGVLGSAAAQFPITDSVGTLESGVGGMESVIRFLKWKVRSEE